MGPENDQYQAEPKKRQMRDTVNIASAGCPTKEGSDGFADYQCNANRAYITVMCYKGTSGTVPERDAASSTRAKGRTYETAVAMLSFRTL